VPSRTLLKGSGKSQPSIHIFSEMIFKRSELTVAALAAKGEDSSEESEEVGHPSHFASWPDTFQKITPNMDFHVQHKSNFKPQFLKILEPVSMPWMPRMPHRGICIYKSEHKHCHFGQDLRALLFPYPQPIIAVRCASCRQ